MPMKIISCLSSLVSMASASIVLYFLGSFSSFECMLEWKYARSSPPPFFLSRRYIWYPGSLN